MRQIIIIAPKENVAKLKPKFVMQCDQMWRNSAIWLTISILVNLQFGKILVKFGRLFMQWANLVIWQNFVKTLANLNQTICYFLNQSHNLKELSNF